MNCTNSSRGLARASLLAVLLASTSACAVLTETQVEEVHTFAHAARAYSDLPGAALNAFSEVRLKNGAFKISTTTEIDVEGLSDRERAEKLERLKQSTRDSLEAEIRTARTLTSAADQSDAALEIVGAYAELLKTLTADSFTEELSRQTAELSRSLDGAVAAYNQRLGPGDARLSAPVSIAAGAVRGVLGLFIKRQQTQLLKKYVREADASMGVVFARVGELLASDPQIQAAEEGASDPIKKDLCKDQKTVFCDLQYEKRALQSRVDSLVLRDGLDPITTEMVLSNLYRMEIAEGVVIRSARAAKRLRAAHAQLKTALEARRDLGERIREVRVVVDEIDQARKLAKAGP